MEQANMLFKMNLREQSKIYDLKSNMLESVMMGFSGQSLDLNFTKCKIPATIVEEIKPKKTDPNSNTNQRVERYAELIREK